MKRFTQEQAYEQILQKLPIEWSTEQSITSRIEEWVEHRYTCIKKEYSSKGLTGFVNKLIKVSENDIYNATQILDNALLGKWETVYPLRMWAKETNCIVTDASKYDSIESEIL